MQTLASMSTEGGSTSRQVDTEPNTLDSEWLQNEMRSSKWVLRTSVSLPDGDGDGCLATAVLYVEGTFHARKQKNVSNPCPHKGAKVSLHLGLRMINSYCNDYVAEDKILLLSEDEKLVKGCTTDFSNLGTKLRQPIEKLRCGGYALTIAYAPRDDGSSKRNDTQQKPKAPPLPANVDGDASQPVLTHAQRWNPNVNIASRIGKDELSSLLPEDKQKTNLQLINNLPLHALQIFCDGSWSLLGSQKPPGGAAAVFYKDDRLILSIVRGGPCNQSHRAEIWAVELALKELLSGSIAYPRGETVHIFSDNQSVLKMLSKGPQRAKEEYKDLFNLIDELTSRKPQLSIFLFFIFSHCGERHHDLADQKAKEARLLYVSTKEKT